MMTDAQYRRKQRRDLVLLPHKGRGPFYKYFDVYEAKLLRGPFSFDTTLQQTGDAARATGRLTMCANGWHAWNGRTALAHHLGIEGWRNGHRKVFRVHLTDIKRCRAKHKGKVVARTIALGPEVTYGSVEGRAIRALVPKDS